MRARRANGDGRRTAGWLVLAVCLMVAVGCARESGDQTAVSPTAIPDDVALASPSIVADDPTAVSAAEATVTPELDLTPTETPTVTPTSTPATSGAWGVAAAPAGTFVTARPGAGMPHSRGSNIVPVYDAPEGEPRVLMDANEIDGIDQPYPLSNPTVFRQPLVLRVIAGGPDDEWLLVQAPVRPHRQSVWVRAEDFVYAQTDLRIEVDLGRGGLLTLFDDDLEVITSLVVHGRESRPTVLHETYVEQAFEGTTLSPAYGTYILTMGAYSETLGTYGGGGLPGQSIHGTNQPELIGQRVSSGGIRVSNEVIDFIYQQPGVLGASVVIYDSSGIGVDAAIAVQRNKPWAPAFTTAMDDGFLINALPITSYS